MTPTPCTRGHAAIGFGPFVYERSTRCLRRDGALVPIGGRALDLLGAFLERPGEMLSRGELVAQVWPRTVVEETSLRVQVSALRRALGDGQGGARYIATVPGRGYVFIGEVETRERGHVRADQLPSGAGNNLPNALTSLVGRDGPVSELRAQFARRRLVSVVGAGGMGKTVLALAVARTLLDRHPDGVRFVDLSTAPGHRQVPALLASALGVDPTAAGGWAALAAHLRQRQQLLVLDNCEHVIDTAAELAYTLLLHAPGVHLLITSREPLNIPDEWIYRLPPLRLPDRDDDPNVPASPAAQLFLERAQALDDGFALMPGDLTLVNQLCRQLDGMPLAIELAAARVDSLGLHGVVGRLSDMVRLLSRGHRVAAPRHQTLQALFDWSHDLLGEDDRRVLRRLAVFRGAFTLGAAASIVACGDIDESAAMESVLSLVSKSLVTVDRVQGGLSYRLLSTTRSYALMRLVGCGEWEATARRLADHERLRQPRATGNREGCAA